MTASGLPFDDFRNLAAGLPSVDDAAAGRVRAVLSARCGVGTLGLLEDAAAWFAAATGRSPARVARPTVALFAGTHAVCARLGVEDPVAEMRAAVEAVAAGAAPVSHVCSENDLGLNVFDLALDMPVGDITREPALDERSCAATMAFGMEAVAAGADLLCLGTAGRGGDLSAMAVLSALGHADPGTWPEGMAPLVEEALAAHRGHLDDPLEAMRRLGGREIAAIAGAVLAARSQKVAIVLEGRPALAAVSLLHALNARAIDHCLLAGSDDALEWALAARLGLMILPGVGVRGVDGVPAALASGMVKTASGLAAGLADVAARAV